VTVDRPRVIRRQKHGGVGNLSRFDRAVHGNHAQEKRAHCRILELLPRQGGLDEARRDPDDAVAFQLALGPAGEVYREAGEIAERRRDEIVAALKEALSGYVTEEGVVMGSSSWKVTARKPA